MSVVSHQRIQILHVDDNPSITNLTATFLEREDDQFAVETANSADEGVQRINDCQPDCVVSDYNMPGMDGLEFLKAIREDNPDLPFILFTGKGSEAVASDAISAGVTDYLQKESGTNQFTVLANRITNVVEKERVQEQFSQQNEQLDTVLSHSPLVSFAFDTDGVFTLFRGQGVNKLEFMPGDVVGESVFDVFADNSDIVAAAETALDGEQTTETHEVAGAVYQTTYNPVFDDDGTVSSVTGVAIDITERHEREQELRQFKEVIEATSHSIYITDADGTIEYVNPTFETTTGYSAEEAIGRAPRILKSGEHDEEFYAELWETILAGDTWQGELINTTKDSERYIINQTITPVTDDAGEIINFVAVNTNITERRRRERELQKTRQRLEAIQEYSKTPMFMKDDEVRYTFVNRAYKKVFGIDGEIVGKTAHDLHPSERAERIETDDRRVIENEEHLEFEERVTLDGETRTFLTRATPIYGTGQQSESGEADALFGVASDITTLKRRERELERERDRLDQFATIVSHDLRNPLNVASTRLELASEECESAHLGDVAGALDRMETLIEDVLTIAREGTSVQETERVSLPEMVEDCWSVVKTGKATLRIEAEHRIQADPGRLKQLLENLVRNAIDHGGDDVTVTVGEIADGVYVADDGTGIPAEEREEVFETGYSTTDSGTGFGLNIVQEIVEAHGWEISVTDSDDGGARFEIAGVDSS